MRSKIGVGEEPVNLRKKSPPVASREQSQVRNQNIRYADFPVQRSACSRSRSLHTRLHLWPIGHRHAIGVNVLGRESIGVWHSVEKLIDPLSMANVAVFVSKK